MKQLLKRNLIKKVLVAALDISKSNKDRRNSLGTTWLMYVKNAQLQMQIYLSEKVNKVEKKLHETRKLNLQKFTCLHASFEF